MRLKHNKKRNTAFVYEALVRELTESVVRNNKNKQNKIVSIIKEHFGKTSTLKKELDLYQSIYETRHIDKSLAEKIVVQVKQEHDSLDKKILFQEQSAMINKINRKLSNKLYNNFVPNYKSLATIGQLFNNEDLPVKEKVILEEVALNYMTSHGKKQIKESNMEPVDNIVYSKCVDRFNDRYNSLNENQINLLS